MKKQVYDRLKNYRGTHCFQYETKLKNLKEDMELANLTEEDVKKLRISDFVFEKVNPRSKEVEDFNRRNEWLEEIPNSPHPNGGFCCRLKSSGIMTGLIVMAIPNTISKVYSDISKELSGIVPKTGKPEPIEVLISRGSTISWAPKNLGSWLVMNSIRWMVNNTNFRFFTAYSDPEARELGTIYQACNFHYLGSNFGTKVQYYDIERVKREDKIEAEEIRNGVPPEKRRRRSKQGWFWDRELRKKSKYMQYAKNIEPEFYEQIGFHDYEDKMFGFVSWRKAQGFYMEDADNKLWKNIKWENGIDPVFIRKNKVKREKRHTALKWKPNWGLMEKRYPGLKERLVEELEKYRGSCKVRYPQLKHKYVYILGKDKRETKYLKKLFFENNPKLKGKEFNYPTERGK